MKIFLQVVAGLFFGFNLFLAWCGFSTVFLTFTIYFLTIYVLVKTVKHFTSDSNLRSNVILSVVVFFSMLFVSELVIKYGFKRYLSYSEADGDIFYVSPYPRNTIGNIIMGKLKGKTIFERTVNEPNDIDGLERSEYSYAHRYNKLGLRGKLPDQLPDSIKAKTTLLLTLGDSFTEGMGAPEDSTWIALLEHYLNKQGDKCCPYFGVNGGVIGAEPVMEYKVLERLAESYRFRDVFLAINESDIYDLITAGGFERYSSNGFILSRKPPWFDSLYGFSFIARAVVHDVFHYNYFLMSDEQYEIEKQHSYNIIYDAINNYYLPLARKSGFRLWIVLCPGLYELENDMFDLTPLNEKLKQLPELSVINLFEKFKTRKIQLGFEYRDLFWSKDGHHNAKGYNLWAACVAEEYTEQLSVSSQLVVEDTTDGMVLAF